MSIAKINIAIVDDHTLLRKGIVSLMKEFEELNILFEAGNGEQMIEMLKRNELPDVVLMDINMPGIDGYGATSWLREKYHQVKVLALSMFDDEKSIVGMIKSGACGYVLKDTKPSDLLEAIKMAHREGFYLNELVSGKLIHSIKNGKTMPMLSDRELEFIKLCCSELTYKEIADVMFVSPRTVDNYRESLFLKLSLKSRTGLVLYCIQNHFVKL